MAELYDRRPLHKALCSGLFLCAGCFVLCANDSDRSTRRCTTLCEALGEKC